MNNGRFTIILVIGLVLVGIGLAAFTVDQREMAIKLRFGEVVAEESLLRRIQRAVRRQRGER